MDFWSKNNNFKPTEKQKVGAIGENLAEKYLKKNGFSILDRNYRKQWGEIDIVAKKGNRIYFVEVKTVTINNQKFNGGVETKNDNYEPEDNIHPWKLKRLERAIETYLSEKNIDDEIDWQLDAISVYLDEKGELIKLDYLEDIF